MVRQRKHDGKKLKQSGRPPRQPSKPKPKESSTPPGAPTADNMQYVSNSRSKARLQQFEPQPGFLRWLFRLRLIRTLFIVMVAGFSGFLVGRVVHIGFKFVDRQGGFQIQRHENLRPHQDSDNPDALLQGGAQHHHANAKENEPQLVRPIQQPFIHLDMLHAKRHGGKEETIVRNEKEQQHFQKVYDEHAAHRNKANEMRELLQNAGQQNAGQQNAGQQNAGQQNAGQQNAGQQNAGQQNAGQQNAGQQNAGQQNAGQQNAGQQNAGQQNAGQQNAGQQNAGQQNAGQQNAGQQNAGQQNAGQQNAGQKAQGIDQQHQPHPVNQQQIVQKQNGHPHAANLPNANQPKIADIPSDIETYPYHVIQTLTNTHKLPHLKTRFIECTKSILAKTSINLHFYFVVDEQSKQFVIEALQSITNLHIAKNKFQFHFIEVEELGQQLAPLVSMLQEKVTGGHPYYQDAIFFLSVAIHRGILPSYVRRIVMLDTDLKFMTDIKRLFDRFDLFTSNNIMGMAREMQPVYRHLLSFYRSMNKGTKVGDPPPDGLTGFNSGVVLLDLEKMRNSAPYHGFVNADKIHQLTDKYYFKGHLGDQDFYTLISLERPDLFHILPCSWNRQLCTWWRDKGYTDVFDQYYKCDMEIDVYHGNCNTPILY